MYMYETHLHTSPVSRCARASVEESLKFYKALGYDGVFVTNHFLDGNLNYDQTRPYDEQIEFYFSDYEKAVTVGKELGIKVFCGVELSLLGTDFLIYGLNKQWYLEHPEIMDMKKSDELKLMMESGALIIQAHPFRDNIHMDHIRLFPKSIHGVEIVNASRKDAENDMAKLFANHYGLLEFAGSDNHKAEKQRQLAGICCREPIRNEADFISKVLNRETEIFHQVNPLFVPDAPK